MNLHHLGLCRYRYAAVPQSFDPALDRRLRPRVSHKLFQSTEILTGDKLHFQRLLNNWCVLLSWLLSSEGDGNKNPHLTWRSKPCDEIKEKRMCSRQVREGARVVASVVPRVARRLLRRAVPPAVRRARTHLRRSHGECAAPVQWGIICLCCC